MATLTMAVSYADRQALAVLAPTVTKALNISEAEYGWLLAAFSCAYLLGAPLAGRWIDRIGARRGLLWAVLVWSAVSALHALVPGLAALFVLRIALGLAEAPSFPGAAQTIHRSLAPADRPRGFGVLFIGSSLGAMLVPKVATKLEHAFNFRVALLGVAFIGALWIPLWLLVTRSQETRVRLDQQTDSEGLSKPSVLVGLRHPAVMRSVLLTLAVSPLMSYALNWSSTLLVKTLGVTQEGVGNLLWFPPVLYDIASIGFGIAASAQLRKHGPTIGPPRLLLTASLLLALSVALIPFAHSPWAATIIFGVAMAGGGGLFALNTADLLSRVPSQEVSTAAGISAGSQALAYVIANPLIGWGVQHAGYPVVTWSLGLWLLPGSLAWLLWSPPPRATT